MEKRKINKEIGCYNLVTICNIFFFYPMCLRYYIKYVKVVLEGGAL